MLDNMECDLVVNYCEYPPTREMWNGLSNTYNKKCDGFYIFNLTVKTNNMKRGLDNMEQYFRNLQRIWREIETRKPNPMECTKDIQTSNNILLESKLYQYLTGVGDEFDAKKREFLKDEPKPTPEEPYVVIQTERGWRLLMGSEPQIGGPSLAIALGIRAGLVVNLQADYRWLPTISRMKLDKDLPPIRA